MTATKCAWCGAHSNMIISSRPTEGHLGNTSKWAQSAFECNQCHKLSVGTAIIHRDDVVPGNNESRWWDSRDIKWTPQTVGGKEFPDVPTHIAAAADEAFRCHSIATYRAAILMARAVIEATCKDNKVTKGQLADKIDAMTDKGLIRSFTQEAAHELRHLGNDMAHGDFIGDVDNDDAEAVLTVMAEILNEVYQGPARSGRMKAKREAAKQQGASPLAIPSRSSLDF